MKAVSSVINGVNLQKVANLIIDQPCHFDVNNLEPGDIIFCKTDYISMLFRALITVKKPGPYKLVTHCSDYSIDENIFKSKPACISKWFAQNANYQHPDLIPVPIGLENHKGYSKGTGIDISYLENWNKKLLYTHRQNTVYCNFSLNTHRSRQETFNTLKNKEFCVFDSGKPYADYCNEMKKHRFVASPRGNGIDCHRTWEALYMGCIPIVERHPMYDSWVGLPIIQIDDWNKVDDVVNLYTNGSSNKAMLDVKYWLDIINNYAC
jgi:hypothetical protein